jgi:hypothetical protein
VSVVKQFIAGAVFFVGLVSAVSGQVVQSPSVELAAQARYKIFVMEGVLERAVANGAAILSRQVRAVAPDSLLLTGQPEARGFRLDSYGVFFDVQVPALRRSVAWTLRTMADDNGVAATTALAQLRAHIQTVSDPRMRADLQRALRRLELQVGPGPMQTSPGVATAGSSPLAGPSTASQRVDVPDPATAGQVGAAIVDPALLLDPNEAYTREVKEALIDAMLENSGPLGIGAEEWLTVAARDNERGDRLVPGDAYDVMTIVFRIKGSDLADFRAGRISLEEARQRVDVREF